MKKVYISIASLLLLGNVMLAQSPANRTAQTVVADVLAQMPVQQQAEYNAAQEGENQQLAVFAADSFLGTICAQHLPHKNTYCVAHGGADNRSQIVDGTDDIQSADDAQTAGGKALTLEGNGHRPKGFVENQGHDLGNHLLHKRNGDVQTSVKAVDKGKFQPVFMSPQGDDCQLHIPGDHCGNGGTVGTHGGRAEMAENQHIVQK